MSWSDCMLVKYYPRMHFLNRDEAVAGKLLAYLFLNIWYYIIT